MIVKRRPYNGPESILSLQHDLNEKEILNLAEALKDLDKYKRLVFEKNKLDFSDYSKYNIRVELGNISKSKHLLNIIVSSVVTPPFTFDEYVLSFDLKKPDKITYA